MTAVHIVFAQEDPYPNWKNYNTGNDVYAIAEEGDFLWVSVSNGEGSFNEGSGYLIKSNKKTGEKKFFNSSNSNLPTNPITTIAIDKNGNKWFGTNGGGLIKYDGQEWSHFTPRNSKLHGYEVTDIAIDEKNQKWIGTTGSWGKGGLVSVKDDNWVIYDSVPDLDVQSIAIDEEGNKWIGMDKGLTRFDGKEWKIFITENSGLPFDKVSDIVIDKRGTKWIVCTGRSRKQGRSFNKNFLVRFDGQEWQVLDGKDTKLPGNNIHDLGLDGNGSLWIGTEKGLARYNESKWKIYDTTNSNLKEPDISSVHASATGVTWIGTNAGLHHYSKSKKEIKHESLIPLPGDGVQAMAIEGDVKWIGNGAHLLKKEGSEWTRYNHRNSGLPRDGDVGAIAVDEDQNKWIAKGSKLIKYDGNNWLNIKVLKHSALSGSDITTLTIDNEGHKWIGTSQNGIGEYNGDSLKVYNSSKSNPEITALKEDEKGNKRVATNKGGVIRLNQGYLTFYNESYSMNTMASDKGSIAIDHKGNVWMGTKGGLYKYNKSNHNRKKIRDIDYRYGINSIIIDEQGNKWMALYPERGSKGNDEKLIKYNGEIVTSYKQEDSEMPKGHINFITIDQNNNLWVGTSCCLGKLKIGKQ